MFKVFACEDSKPVFIPKVLYIMCHMIRHAAGFDRVRPRWDQFRTSLNIHLSIEESSVVTDHWKTEEVQISSNSNYPWPVFKDILVLFFTVLTMSAAILNEIWERVNEANVLEYRPQYIFKGQ